MGIRPDYRAFALATISVALWLPCSVSAADRAAGHRDEDVEARERWFGLRRDAVDGKDAWKRRLNAAQQLRANLAAGKLVVTGSGDSWSSLGPSPLIDTGHPFTGRVTAIATHPTDPTVWVGTANGGVWTTTDGGTTWTPKTDLQDTLSIGAIAINRTNPQIVWVGTGEANAPFCPVYGGMGLLKTTDGGASWTPMAQSVFAGSGISAVVISPANSQVMYVANRAGQHGTGVCVNSAGPYGVWKSTDGGVTWARTLSAPSGTDGSVSDLQVCPTNASILLAGVPGSGVWRSTDGGSTWARLTIGLPAPGAQGRVEIAFDPVTTSTVYVSEEAAAGGHLGVWKSTNLGGSFVAVGKPGAGACQFWAISDICTYADINFAQCFFYHDLAVAPNHDVWLAGLGVARSTDGGTTWTHVCQQNVHVDQHALAFGPNGLVWLGNDGGVMTTTDGGATWNAHNAGLDISQFYPGPSAHPTNASFLLGGTQDNGAVLYTGSPTWSLVFGGDIWGTAISTGAPETRWYVAGSGFQIERTFDAGAHWSPATQGVPNGEPADTATPWTFCPDDAHVFIAVSDNVWRSDNAMDDWTANSPDPLEAQNVYGTAATFLSKGNGCQTYFAGFKSGALWRTLDGGASWTKIGAFAGIVSDLRSDPRSPATLWATIQG